MNRFIVVALLATLAFDARASTDTCRVVGTAHDFRGRPLPAAVIRLTDRKTQHSAFRAADANAGFVFEDVPADARGDRYRLDLVSPPTIVTGSHLPRRSVLGIARPFTCAAGQTVEADVRVGVR